MSKMVTEKFEINKPTENTETPAIEDYEHDDTVRNESMLRKIGSKILNIFPTTGGLYLLGDTIKDMPINTPAGAALLLGSAAGATAINYGGDAIKSRLEKRRKKKTDNNLEANYDIA